MVTHILTWWFVVQVIGLMALPITAFVFRALPDRGYALSKALGLLLTGYGAWLLAMLGLGSFGVPLLLFVLVVIGGGGLALQHQKWWARGAHVAEDGAEEGTGSGRSLLERVRAALPVVIAYEVIFVVALVAMAWLRSYMPDPWGTERPMDLAFFNAIQRSATFPPHDPWLAGYSINYYYFGYLLMAVVAMLSGLEAAVAFNLSLALIFALTALGIAGLLANLIRMTREHAAQRGNTLRSVWRQFFSVYTLLFIPLLGSILVLVVGNQAGALQVMTGDYRVVALDGEQLAAAMQQSLDTGDELTLPAPVHTGDFGTFEVLERGDRVADFNWWWPSRALWDENVDGQRHYNITEFPFFSFWLGDMHPHVMALPFNLLAVALALQLVASSGAAFWWQGRGPRWWLELVLTGIVLGSLYTINSWDLPTYMLLYAGALLLVYVRRARQTGAAVQWMMLGRQLGAVVLAAFVLFFPFFLTFHSLVGFAEPLIDLPVLDRLTSIIAPYNASRSGLHSFVIIFGLFMVPLIGFVYGLWVSGTGQETGASEQEPEESEQEPANRKQGWDVWLALLFPVLLVIGLVIGFPLLALAGLGVFALFQAVQRADAPAESFVLLVVALGCAILFGTELIYIRDVFSSRMNTIFKFYYQVWLLWGTIAAYAVWWSGHWVVGTGKGEDEQGRRRAGYRVAAGAVLVVFVVLLVGGMVYPVINVRNLVEHGTQVGLQGKTPRETSEAGEASVHWLREHAAAGSVVLEAVGGAYNSEGYGGVAASTGIPTVLGWPGHERQWRGGHEAAQAEIGPREMAVETIYSTSDTQVALDLLQEYEVDYVYVGALERQRYGESVYKFGTIGEMVFQQGEVTIYAVGGG